MEKNHVNKNAHSQIRTNQISLGLASVALVTTLVMSGFYVADTISGKSNLRNVLATIGFCPQLETAQPKATPSASSEPEQPESDSSESNAPEQTGVSGASGQDGADGADGADGKPGPAGEQGEPGDQGETGPAGPAGTQGPAGTCSAILDLELFNGNIVPAVDNVYTLGSAELRWKDLQLGPGTLYIEDAITGEQVGVTVNEGSFLIDGAESLRLGNIRLTATGLESILNDQDITIGNLGDTGYVVLARGLKFPDGTIQSTAGSGGAVGPEGPAGPPGPQGEPGDLGGFVETDACVENKHGPMLGPIDLGTCADNKKTNGTDIKILMKLP
jgi:Collagen triple helix repeat (20 copies)